MARAPRTAEQEAERKARVEEEGEEFFYEDSNGRKRDADLHGPIIRAVEWPIDEKIMGPIRDKHRYGDKKPKSRK